MPSSVNESDRSALPGGEVAGELIAVVQRLSLARSLPEVQQIVRTAARRLSGADGATFVLRDGDFCFYADEDAIQPLWKGRRFPIDDCVSGWAMLNRRPAVIADIYADDRIPHEAYRPTFVKSLVMVPIRTLDPIGAIGTYWASNRRPGDGEVEVLRALADSTAIALENVRVIKELEDARLETLRRLAIAAEYRDDATFEHTLRVARVTKQIAERLGMPSDEVALLEQAAPLHDIGKLAVSDTLLRKPGRLTPAEFAQMKRHAEAGAEILSGSASPVLRKGAEIAVSHHEWWNGAGYPNGLRGRAIPLSGRIVALADVFDALTHERPYKRPWPVNQALAEITQLSGRQFDPAVVNAFASLDPEELIRPSVTPQAA